MGREEVLSWYDEMNLPGGEIPCPSPIPLWHWRRGHPSKRWARRFLAMWASQLGYRSAQLGPCQPSRLREVKGAIGLLNVASRFTGWEEKRHKAGTMKGGKTRKIQATGSFGPLSPARSQLEKVSFPMCLLHSNSKAICPLCSTIPEQGRAQSLSCLQGLQWSLGESQTNTSSPHHLSAFCGLWGYVCTSKSDRRGTVTPGGLRSLDGGKVSLRNARISWWWRKRRWPPHSESSSCG